MSALTIVRVRGGINARRTIRDAMDSLNLTRPNHCVIVPDTPEFRGMVQMCKDYVTFGPTTKEEAAKLIRERGRLMGDKPVTDEHVKANSPYASIEELASAMAEGKFRYGKVEGVKPIFRLNPPRKGFKGGLKRSYAAHGNLGDRGNAIVELIERML